MRDLIIFAIVFGLIPFILKRPVTGVLAFTWISLMNPHRLAYGPAFDFPFAAVVAGLTLVSLAFAREPKRLPITPVTLTLILFAAWMTVTTFSAFGPVLAWTAWEQVMKMFFMTLLAMLVLNSKEDIKTFAWVVGLSLAFYGFKGGVFTLASSGGNRVFGPPGTNIGDNNDLALALITILPIIWYLQLQVDKRWLRNSLIGLALLTLIASAGTYSRGALLAGAAMLFFLWLKNGKKLRNGFVLLLIVPVVFAFMPEQWFARMVSIDDYKEDASALGRINAWHFATNVAKSHITGGGFKVFTPEMFLAYAPDPLDFHAAHSIYFQVLGDHGFIGLSLFLLLMVFTWRTGTRINKYCKGKPEFKWASDLAVMTQTSIIGYAVGGAFLSLAYFDLYYNLVVLLVALEKIVLLNLKEKQNSNFRGITNKKVYSGPQQPAESSAHPKIT